MFETLSDRFDRIFTKLRGRGRLSEEDVNEVLREIRVALLEADVNLEAAREFIEAVRSRATDAELSKSLTPAQQVIKIVHEELTATLGGEALRLQYASRPPTVVLLAGLQGSGKTTAAAKLARWFRQQGRHPLLVGADRQRPAAVEQLTVLGRQVGASVFSEDLAPAELAKRGVEQAERVGRDVVIIDTAGRLSIDAELMAELHAIEAATRPHYSFLVIDSMIGQDALTTAEGFSEAVSLHGVILTKLDGDARGGAALSVKHVLGKPIAFASTGEGVEDFELFHPERLAGRILGMGDVLSLIEKAEREYDEQVAAEAMDRLKSGRFTLEDFHEQIQQMKKMGPLQSLLSMMPGLPKEVRQAKIGDEEVARVEAIIRSMTPAERDEPSVIDGSRRLRIANGSGTTTTDVNNLLRQFKEMQKLMRSSPMLAALNRGGRQSKKKQKGGRVTPSLKSASR